MRNVNISSPLCSVTIHPVWLCGEKRITYCGLVTHMKMCVASAAEPNPVTDTGRQIRARLLGSSDWTLDVICEIRPGRRSSTAFEVMPIAER